MKPDQVLKLLEASALDPIPVSQDFLKAAKRSVKRDADGTPRLFGRKVQIVADQDFAAAVARLVLPKE